MAQINMPRLSDSMEEGVVLKWLVEPGGQVAAGDDLVEIETDKATMTYQSEAGGALEVIVAEGGSAAVGEPIARLGDGRGPAVGGGGRVAASPLARRIAEEHGIAIAALAGTGPRGRVMKADVLAATGAALAPARPAAAAAPSAPPGPAAVAPAEGARGGSTHRAATRLQQVIARRMSEVKATVPDFQVETEVTMDEAIALRSRLKEIALERPAPSINDLIVKAAAVALREHPRANGSYRDDGFELYSHVNVGIAVATEEALVVPTIFDADRKSLGEIGRESRRLAERVRSGEITPPELSGATFTVSNLGMLGATAVTPIVDLQQAAILGVGAMREVLRRDAGEIVDATVMTMRLSADHRILYGADAARFLADVKALLEEPLRLIL